MREQIANLFGPQAMKAELTDECNYVLEASFLNAFGSPEFLGNDPHFKVPWVWAGSTTTVLVMEHVDGVGVGEADMKNLTQSDRNNVCSPYDFLPLVLIVFLVINFCPYH